MKTHKAEAIWLRERSVGLGRRGWLWVALCVWLGGAGGWVRGAEVAKRVILVTTDGLRWQEVFRGAEASLLNKTNGGVADTNAVQRDFWRPTAEARRAALFPFLWGTVAKRGQLWGNQDVGSVVRVLNGHNFSYPGYSEFLTGVVDRQIDSNDKVLNRNVNVFEWLNSQEGFQGKVVATVNWGVLPWILNAPRAGIPVWSPFEVPEGSRVAETPRLLQEVVAGATPYWKDVVYDTFLMAATRHVLATVRPRAMYVSFGETDDWAHEGRYDLYLRSAQAFDRGVKEIWDWVQATPEYRDQTVLMVTTDHGRGTGPVAWKNHGKAIADSNGIWVAVMGPGVPAMGERKETSLVTQGQVAATVAAAVGLDYRKANPAAAASFLPEIQGR